MRKRLRSCLSVVLSMALMFCMVPMTYITASANENNNVVQTMDNIQDGTILHCFNWKYTDIIEELDNIKAAGFTAVQTSPAQPAGNKDTSSETYKVWWWLYQPLSFSIANDADTAYLGTKAELTQLCQEAHSRGIKVIVDMVANHLAGDHTYIQEDLKNEEYWRPYHDYKYNEKTGVDDRKDPYWKDKDSRYITTHKALGMPDIVSENVYVQQRVADYINELKSVGVDGLRWDTLKHIQVPSEDCAFFTNAIAACDGMYNYGESLGSPDASTEEANRVLMQEYTDLMSVTDDVYGNKIRKAFASGNMPDNIYGNWTTRGVSAEKLVYWAESHDTWSNAEDGNGDSTNVPQEVIDRVYAVVASREGATSLYFSRPSEKKKDSILAGVKGSTNFTNPQVAEVNLFHNTFNNRSEYLSTFGNIVYNERGTKGVVLVNAAGGSVSISVPAHRMADGIYTDQVTKTQFTVQNGIISGTIGSSGIAVVYDPDNLEELPVVVPDTLYLKPNSEWTESSARFAAYFFDKNEHNAWVSMVSAGSGVYSVTVPEKYNWTNVIFCRMRANTSNNWDNKLAQTADLDMPVDENTRFTLNSTGNSGSWDNNRDHSYGAPVWYWGGTSSAIASFTCTICGHHNNVEAAISKSITSEAINYTATISGTSYSDVKSVPRTKCRVVYLKPNTNWTKDDAILAAYIWTGDTNAWVTLTDSDGDGYYSAELPYYASTDWEKVIFCRINPNSTETDNWKKVWNKTADLTFLSTGENCYNIKDGVWTEDADNKAGTWDNYTPVHTHTYGEPVWTWADDHGSASAEVICTVCGRKRTYDADVTSAADNGVITYTATVNINNVQYTDTAQVNDDIDEVLVKCEAYKKLSADNQLMYREILLFARSVVRGEQTSSSFGFIPNIKKTWTFAELELSSDATYQQAYDKINGKVGDELQTVFYALLADCPYEFYWYSKSKNGGYLYGLSGASLSRTSEAVTINNQPALNVSMTVSLNYRDNITSATSIKKTAINAVKNTVPAAARAIVARYADDSDYDKLKGYAQAICGLVNYNNDAAVSGVQNNDMDPWQLVYVFDGNTTTDVVCEGYSKAFKYLCDLTEFDSPFIKCYLVSGMLSDGNGSGGGHMWNIVTMDDGKNYLVDVTNSDECNNRRYDAFLLNGGTLNNGWYPISSRNSSSDILYYQYYDLTESFWGNEILTLSSTNYTPAEKYTVTWVNYDNTVLETDENVVSGTMPKYDGATPSKDSDLDYSYEFKGWSPELSSVTGNVTYRAQFDSIPIDKVTVTFYNFIEWDNVYVHYWNNKGNSTAWPGIAMTSDDGLIYTVDIPVSATGILFDNGDISNIAKTGDIAFNAADGQIWAVSENNGSMTTSTVPTYYLVGQMNNWSIENNDLVFVPNKNSDKAEEYILTAELDTANNNRIKVCSSTGKWFPENSGNAYNITAEGTYKITFRPNGKSDWYQNYFRVENAVTITYTDINGTKTVIDESAGVVSFDKSKFSLPSTPYLDGYDLNGWIVNGDVINNYDYVIDAVESYVRNNEAVTIKPNYVKKTQTYSVEVVDGTLASGLKTTTYRPSDLIRVTADDKSTENKVFDHWTVSYDEGVTSVIVSYNNKYYFRMPSKNIRLEAVFVDSGTQTSENKGTAYIESVTNPADNKLAFVAILTVPDNAHMLKAGVIVQKEVNLGGNELTTENMMANKYVDTSKNNYSSFKYTLTINISNSAVSWCVRPYLEYSDDTGIHVIYGNTVSASLDSIS